jgi:hypothetical protein
MTPWLTDAEIDDLCAGLVQNAAKLRYLRDDLKLKVATKPNGRPLLHREHYDQVMCGLPTDRRKRVQPAARPPAQPNAAGLKLAFSRKS